MTRTSRPRTRTLALAVVLAVAGALFSSLVSPGTALASHYRGASLTWTHIGSPTSNQVQFHLVWSQRLSYESAQNVGQQITSPGIAFGDGTSDFSNLTITNVDRANDLAIGEVTVTHTYPSGTTKYTASASNCCRLGVLTGDVVDGGHAVSRLIGGRPPRAVCARRVL